MAKYQVDEWIIIECVRCNVAIDRVQVLFISDGVTVWRVIQWLKEALKIIKTDFENLLHIDQTDKT